MSLYASLSGKGPSGFGYASTAADVTEGLNLAGKTYAVTGATSGIGLETVRVLLSRGARVVALGRKLERLEQALDGAKGRENLSVQLLELSDLNSVSVAAKALRERADLFDALILNAGVMALPKLELCSGFERQFFTNHIGHYYFARLLEASLAERGRVVVLSSEAHRAAPAAGVDFDNLRGEKSYSAWSAYGRSKLANLLFAFEFGERLARSGRIAHAVHPGVIDTPLNRHLPGLARAAYSLGNLLFLKTVPQGAATQMYVATHPEVRMDEPRYWSNCNLSTPRPIALDVELRKKLWRISAEIVNELGPEKVSD